MKVSKEKGEKKPDDGKVDQGIQTTDTGALNPDVPSWAIGGCR